MPYWKRLFSEAFRATWDLVVAQTIPKLIIGGLILVVSLILYRRWKKLEDYDQAIRAAKALLTATALVFGLIFIGEILFITPKTLVEKAIADTKDAKTATASAEGDAQKLRDRLAEKPQPVVHFDSTDVEARRELEQAKTELGTANEEIKELRGRVNDRQFSVDGKAELIKRLKLTPKGTIIVKNDWTDGEAQQFAKQIEEVFKESGFTLLKANTEALAINDKGTFVCVKDTTAPPITCNTNIRSVEGCWRGCQSRKDNTRDGGA